MGWGVYEVGSVYVWGGECMGGECMRWGVYGVGSVVRWGVYEVGSV